MIKSLLNGQYYRMGVLIDKQTRNRDINIRLIRAMTKNIEVTQDTNMESYLLHNWYKFTQERRHAHIMSRLLVYD